MKKGAKIVLGVGLFGGFLAILAMALTGKPKTPPGPSPGGPFSLSISVINLPAEATGWGCAFQDPATGIWYQPSNHPATGSFLFNVSEVAEVSAPVSSGLLSVSAFSGVGIASITQLVNYQLGIQIVGGEQLIFDFALGQLS